MELFCLYLISDTNLTPNIVYGRFDMVEDVSSYDPM